MPNDVDVGSRVVVTVGSFKSHQGTVEAIDARTGLAQVRITIFGRDTPVEIPLEHVSGDVAGHDRVENEVRREDAGRWTVDMLASLSATASAPLDEAVGCFLNPSPMASCLRLTLNDDGTLHIERWLDLGGTWASVFRGFYLVLDQVIHTNVCDITLCDTSFAENGRLHIRTSGNRILAPDDSIDELDQVLDEAPDWLDELEDTFFGLNLFFEEAPQ